MTVDAGPLGRDGSMLRRCAVDGVGNVLVTAGAECDWIAYKDGGEVGRMWGMAYAAISQCGGVNDGLRVEFDADTDMAAKAQIAALGIEEFGKLGFVGLVTSAARSDRCGSVNPVVCTGDIGMAGSARIGIAFAAQHSRFSTAVRIVTCEALALGVWRVLERVRRCVLGMAERAGVALLSGGLELVRRGIGERVASVTSVDADWPVQLRLGLDSWVAFRGDAAFAGNGGCRSLGG